MKSPFRNIGLLIILFMILSSLVYGENLVANAYISEINSRKTLCIDINNNSTKPIIFSASDVSYAAGSFAASYTRPWGRGNLPRQYIESIPTPINITIPSNKAKTFYFTLDLLFYKKDTNNFRDIVIFYYFEIRVLDKENNNEKTTAIIPLGGFCKGGP